MRASDQITDDIEAILAAMPANFRWDVQIGIMPDEAGNNIVIAQFFFFATNPVLGMGDLAVVELLPLEMTKNQAVLKALVSRCIEELRKQQTDRLG